MSYFDEYSKHGGLQGQAERDFRKELEKAKTDETHPLREAVRALQMGKSEKSAKLISDVLTKTLTLNDKNSPLYWPAFFHVQIPFALHCADLGAEIWGEDDTFIDLAKKGASRLIGRSEQNAGRAKGGLQKAKNLESINSKILKLWDERSRKELSVAAYAPKIFNELKGKTNEDGNKEKGKIPAIRTIERLLRAYEKKKKTTVF